MIWIAIEGREKQSFEQQTVTIGRASDNDIVIEQLAVSRRHVRLELLSTTQVRVENLGINPIFIESSGQSISRGGSQILELPIKMKFGGASLRIYNDQATMAASSDCGEQRTDHGAPSGTAQRANNDPGANDPQDNPSAQISPAVMDQVHFAAFGPGAVLPGTSFLLDIWAFLGDQYDRVCAIATRQGKMQPAGYKGPVRIARGSNVAILVELPGMRVEPGWDSIDWEGKSGNATFEIVVPADAAAGEHLGRVRIVIAGVQTAQMRFTISVGQALETIQPIEIFERRIRTVFASYASEDRLSVLQWARGAEAVGVDVFVDVASLRAGDAWSERLQEQVTSRDLFCLFWSEAASRSEWVAKEWSWALKSRGCSYIHPVPLVDPRQVPPPAPLAACVHFEDLTRIVMEYEKSMRRAPS